MRENPLECGEHNSNVHVNELTRHRAADILTVSYKVCKTNIKCQYKNEAWHWIRVHVSLDLVIHLKSIIQ